MCEPVAGPEWPIRSELNGGLIGGHPVSLVAKCRPSFSVKKWLTRILTNRRRLRRFDNAAQTRSRLHWQVQQGLLQRLGYLASLGALPFGLCGSFGIVTRRPAGHRSQPS
jgi:hypothetical protein